jgi:ABC-type branched-subunit amino acid transport system substrate-binding protein
MKKLPVLLAISIAFIVWNGILRAQEPLEYSAQAEQTFSRAVESYKAERFAEASAGFELVIKMFSPNQRSTAAYVMRAKSLLRLDEPLEAGRTLRNFFSLYPSSSYVPDAEYTIGLVYLRIQRYDDAVQSFLAAWRSDADVRRTAFEALDRLLGAYITIDAIERLLPQAVSAEERAFYWLRIGEKNAEAGKAVAVGAVLDTLYRNYPGNPFRDRIALLRTSLEQRSNVKMGVLLPLLRRSDPSAVKELGNDIFEGVQFAVEEYSKNPATIVKVTLETRDTERDVLVATRGIQELTSDNDIIGIVGPVFSNEASAVASLANRRGCPLVSPTANANGIAATGPYVFQANPDYETRGRAMARFAVEKKGFRVLAVVAPINSFGKFMGEAFAAEAIRLGATIVATEWYERGAADLKGQMAGIRKAGLRAGSEPMISFGGKMSREEVALLVQLGVPMSRIDSLMNKSAVISAADLLGPQAKQTVDSLGITAVYNDPEVDSLEIPVTAIEGIYIPISSADEIGIVSSQLVYYNIQAQVLGSGEWNNLKELDANKRYCANVIFESDSYVATSDSAYGQFVNAYFDRYKKRPSKNALHGYDTAAMMLSAIHAGGTSREALMTGLQQVKNYQGLHARITFSTKRVNAWLWILQYTADQIQMVDGFNVE